MEVSRESLRVRWVGLVVLWAALTGVLYLHASAFRDNLNLSDRVGLRGAATAPTPMQRVCPTMYADALMWVRHALNMEQAGDVRVRRTDIDNAPAGREVHWNSGFLWLVLAGGKLRQAFTGEPLSVAVEQSMAWFNLPLLVSLIVVVSLWASRRAGLAAGVLLAAGMVGYDEFYGGFSPNYVDHHGLLAVAVLVLVLGGVFMGAGFWKTASSNAQLLPPSLAVARHGAIASAIAGAIGLWISAATLIPAIAIMGFAGIIAAILHGRAALATGVQAAPEVWRLWGRTGALLSLAFYLLEYAPNHFGLRLEVNHPAYAAAWWAAGEIVALVLEWRCLPGGTFRLSWRRVLPVTAAVAIAPAILLLAGPEAFVVLDPFIGRLSRHVAEGITLFMGMKYFGAVRYSGEFLWIGLSVVGGLIAWWRTRAGDRILVAFALFATAAFTLMAISQLRWSASASGPQMVLVMLVIASLVHERTRALRWAAVGFVVLVATVPFAAMRLTRLLHANSMRAVDKTDAMQPVYRDIARALRESQPEGPIVLLASPNASVAISYYGQFRAIGTLYWENLSGMKAAAAMFSAQTESEARRLVRERAVTHVAIVSEDNFIAEYFNLLNPGAEGKTLDKAFGYRALVHLVSPLWLEQIPYELPSDLPFRPQRVLLFKTRFVSPQADLEYEAALAEAEAGDMTAAEKHIDRALEAAPEAAEFWVAKTNLLIARGDLPAAYTAVSRAVRAAAPAQKATICRGEAVRFYQARAHDAAIQLYRGALQTSPDPVTANNLAWVLATTPNDALRNGAEALQLTTQLVTAHREPVFLNTHAAALAESGNFEEAVKVAAEALEATRRLNDAQGTSLAEARLARYRAGQPWRE